MNKLMGNVVIPVVMFAAFTALSAFAIFQFQVQVFSATGTYSSNVAANVAVGNVIYLSVSPNSIYFGSVYPTNSVGTTYAVTDNDIGGNVGANILIYGSNWVNGTNSMGVGNTLWSATSEGKGTPLSNNAVNTGIYIIAPSLSTPTTSNNVYFGLAAIPGGTPPGNYLQTIYFENENVTLGLYNQPSTSNTVTAEVTVQGACYISLSPNAISFNSIYAGANVPTNVVVTDYDQNGNVAANMLVAGTNWALTSNTAVTFGVSNTLWSATSLATYSGNALANSLSTTGITIPAPTQSSATTNAPIYFGLGIPGGTPAGSYTQTITIENSC